MWEKSAPCLDVEGEPVLSRGEDVILVGRMDKLAVASCRAGDLRGSLSVRELCWKDHNTLTIVPEV
jgi:hypothetical protein